MTSLVEELQRDALDQSKSVSELLQKCLVVASKLGIAEFGSWVRLELDGYGDAEVPAYRFVRGIPQVHNPYQGYLNLPFADPKVAEKLSVMHFHQPVGELEHDLRMAEKSSQGWFQMSYAPETEKRLRDNIQFGLQPSLQINASQFRKILDAVRTIILEWSLKLERDGITGVGMSFSREEKNIAQANIYNVENLFQGNVAHSQVQGRALNSPQTQANTVIDTAQLLRVVGELNSRIDQLALNADTVSELRAEIQTLESQTNSPNPKRSILREALGSIGRILENTTGNVVASGLMAHVGAALRMLGLG